HAHSFVPLPGCDNITFRPSSMSEDLHRVSYSTPPRAMLGSMSHRVRYWTSKEVVQPLVEPVLHPSPWRIRAIGVSMLLGHPAFFLLWGIWLPQPFESLGMRMLMGLGGLALLVIPGIATTPPTRGGALLSFAIFWVTLPWFFF